MFVNIINSYRNVVAICDANLLGKTFEQGKLQLDVKESFYKGEKVDSEQLLKVIQFHSAEDATFNIVGEKSIQIALDANLISKESIGKIDNIPYALILI